MKGQKLYIIDQKSGRAFLLVQKSAAGSGRKAVIGTKLFDLLGQTLIK